jgi:putative flippase GtrA
LLKMRRTQHRPAYVPGLAQSAAALDPPQDSSPGVSDRPSENWFTRVSRVAEAWSRAHLGPIHGLIAVLFRYAAVGGISAAVEWLLFQVLYGYFHLPTLLAYIIGFTCVTVVGFIAQKKFTFRNEGRWIAQGRLYVVGVASNLLLGSALVYTFIDILHMGPGLSKALQLALCFAYNFSFARFIVFRPRSQEARVPASR